METESIDLWNIFQLYVHVPVCVCVMCVCVCTRLQDKDCFLLWVEKIKNILK